MEKIVRQSMLFDIYGELLKEHRRRVYEDVICSDLSLAEAAESYGITRQAVHDIIKKCDRALEDYESRLHILENEIKREELIDKAMEMAHSDDLRDVLNAIRSLQ